MSPMGLAAGRGSGLLQLAGALAAKIVGFIRGVAAPVHEELGIFKLYIVGNLLLLLLCSYLSEAIRRVRASQEAPSGRRLSITQIECPRNVLCITPLTR